MGEPEEERDDGAVVDRRRALKRLGLGTGAAVASSWIVDSFTNPAGAAQGWSAIVCDPTNMTVTIPRKRDVYFDVAGAGGGGGNKGTEKNGANGGAGARVQGRIAARSSSYQLSVVRATGGTPHPNGWDWFGLGGTGFRRGGDGGDQGSSADAGPGGGGGGASALSGPGGILVVAGGG
ncbi:MAG: twin-arginine translocation signal domain-containing protein, partial [Actinomycetota bacterium]|nr:twin-arginine translocation signal domain-containing protein [Actinomycetota bacterium]